VAADQHRLNMSLFPCIDYEEDASPVNNDAIKGNLSYGNNCMCNKGN